MREVRISHSRNTWFVVYVQRKKHGHYCAAQFDSRDHGIEKVKSWIAANNLKLVEVSNG